MTDKAILDYVYRELLAGRVHQEIISFIEQEWQKRDELELDEQLHDEMCRHDPWLNNDVKEIERHRGLEIGPDGTVMEVKWTLT